MEGTGGATPKPARPRSRSSYEDDADAEELFCSSENCASVGEFASDAVCGKQPAYVVLAFVGAALTAVGGAALEASFNTSTDDASPLRLRVGSDGLHSHAWNVCYAVALSLALYPLCRAVAFCLLTLLRLPLFSRWYALVLYVSAWDDGPLTTILWGVATHQLALTASGLPSLGQTSTSILVTTTVAGVADGLKNVVIAALHGRAIVEAFTAKVQSAVHRLVLLQNLSTAAVAVARKRRRLLTRYTASLATPMGAASPTPAPAAVALVPELTSPATLPPDEVAATPPLPAPTSVTLPVQHASDMPATGSSGELASTPEALAVTGSDGMLVSPATGTAPTLAPGPPAPLSIPPTVPDGTPAIIHVQVGGTVPTPPSPSPTPPAAPVDAGDLRDFDDEETSYFVLSRYIEEGRFSLFTGRGRMVTVRGVTHAKRITNGLFSALDVLNGGEVTREQLAWGGDGWDAPLGPGWSEESIEGAFDTLGMTNGVSFRRADLLAFAGTAVTDFNALRGTLSTYSAVANAIRLLGNALYYVAMLVFVLVLFRVEIGAVLLSLGTVLVSVSFAIGTPAARLVESLIFLLVTQPFDVGDRVRINGGSAMYVHGIDIYSTTFRRLDGTLVTLANHILAGGEVRNEKRGQHAVLEVLLNIALDSSPAALEALNAAVVAYVRARPDSWVSGVIEFYIYSADPTRNLMEVSFWLKHQQPFQNVVTVFGDKGRFTLFLVRTLAELGIQYSLPNQPVNLLGEGAAALGGQRAPPLPPSLPPPPPTADFSEDAAAGFVDIVQGNIAPMWRPENRHYISRPPSPSSSYGSGLGDLPRSASEGLRRRRVTGDGPMLSSRSLSGMHSAGGSVGAARKKISLTHTVPQFAGITFAAKPVGLAGAPPRRPRAQWQGPAALAREAGGMRKSSSAGELAEMAAMAPQGRGSPPVSAVPARRVPSLDSIRRAQSAKSSQ